MKGDKGCDQGAGFVFVEVNLKRMENVMDQEKITPKVEAYMNLPVLAGLGNFDEAAQEGYSVEQAVTTLKFFHFAFKRLTQIFTARITAEPIYELKMAFSHHAHLCAEHAAALRTRVAEMREPPLGLDRIPDPNLEVFFDEIQCADDTRHLVHGLYHHAVPALLEGVRQYIAETNPLADAPTRRILRFAELELTDINAFGKAALARFQEHAEQVGEIDEQWDALLTRCLAACGGIGPDATPSDLQVERQFSATPYEYVGKPERDERFGDDLYNMGVNAEEFVQLEDQPDEAKAMMLLFKRFREIDVPEMMASIITETPDKPWNYYREMIRQLWDEARHAMMGEVGFAQLGIDWRCAPFTHTFAQALNANCTPIERHAILWVIEQGLMGRTGKRHEWEVSSRAGEGHELLMLFQDYDWADEVLHAAIGRRWFVKDFGNPGKATEYGNTCFQTKRLADFDTLKEQGLTEHRNWWPDFYREACRARGITPNPTALAYNTSYRDAATPAAE
jgi:hypothetical protein